MKQQRSILKQRQRRRFRVRNRLKADANRPRLTVFRSHKQMYAQIVDDQGARTLAAASTQDKELRGAIGYGGNKSAAEAVGRAIAQRALAAGITQVAFDRGHYQYHGRVAALAAAAREAGLTI